jgi:hypothetical protein
MPRPPSAINTKGRHERRYVNVDKGQTEIPRGSGEPLPASADEFSRDHLRVAGTQRRTYLVGLKSRGSVVREERVFVRTGKARLIKYPKGATQREALVEGFKPR